MSGKGRFVTLHPPSPVPLRHGISNSIEMLRVALEYLEVRAELHRIAGDSSAAFRVYWPAPADGVEAGGSWDPAVPGVISIDR